MSTPVQNGIFKAGSTTYFNSSLFFPPAMRTCVFTLYAFVRVADDLVDRLPPDAEGFRRFARAYRHAMAGVLAGDPVIDDYVALAQRLSFDPAWTDAFLAAMEADLSPVFCRTEEAMLHYVHGSAEVIGFFMARIMELPERAYTAAGRLGRAMQVINFIRDIGEDSGLGRRYLPIAHNGQRQPDVADDWLPGRDWALQHPAAWGAFVRSHIARYRCWQAEAEQGYPDIPRRPRIAVKTAADMYQWTARRLEADPLAVFGPKVKPRRSRIVLQALRNSLLG